MLLGIVAKPTQRDKFEVSSDSVAYLTGRSYRILPFTYRFQYKIFSSLALVAVSEEVRSRCHVKHTLPRWPIETNNSSENGNESNNMASQAVSYT